MSDDTRRVLDLLSQGKITVDEADRLIAALGAKTPTPAADTPKPDDPARPKPRWIRIAIHKPANERRGDENVNIRVPITVVRGGMRLGALIAPFAGDRVAARLREKGFDLDLTKLDPDAFGEALRDMGEVNIDVDSGKQQVKITCE